MGCVEVPSEWTASQHFGCGDLVILKIHGSRTEINGFGYIRKSKEV
jgi:hypothetical protein